MQARIANAETMGGRTWSKRNKTRDKFIDQKAPAKMSFKCFRCERKAG